MNSRPKISVIVPVYNVAEYLVQCFDSIVAQDFSDIEVIVVDDGSTDGSSDICSDYCRRYDNFRLITKQNGGLSDARNAGTKIATGEYICFLDSDDYIAPNALRMLYDFATSKGCDIVQGGFYYTYAHHLIYDNRWIESDDAPFVLSKNEAMEQLILNNYVKNFAWGKLYRTDVAKEYPFPVGRYFEDSYWQHIMVHHAECYGVVPEPLYYYRQRESSISGNFSARNIDLLRGYECRTEFVTKHYPHLLPLMQQQWQQLAIQLAEAARHSANSELIGLYSQYLAEQGIKYSRLAYTVNNLAKRIFNRLFSKKLKRIEVY